MDVLDVQLLFVQAAHHLVPLQVDHLQAHPLLDLTLAHHQAAVVLADQVHHLQVVLLQVVLLQALV